jgi:hypothetical protein
MTEIVLVPIKGVPTPRASERENQCFSRNIFHRTSPRRTGPAITEAEHWNSRFCGMEKDYADFTFRDTSDGVVEMISELPAFFLPEGYATAYRQKEMWSPPPRLVLIQLAPVQLEYESPRMTTETRLFSP